MPRSKVRFANSHGVELSGVLEMPELPAGMRAAHHALFAHCFTCGKDSLAAHRISAALARLGIAVLRFDFSGLGESEGDYGAGGFGSDVEDLVAAADWLAREHGAPSLLIGHSLGGTAVLHAAARLDYVIAVATIGAPAVAKHALAQIKPLTDAAELARDRVEVELGQRRFSLTRRFIEELAAADDPSVIRQLGAALLVMHAPGDAVVGIGEAHRIFTLAEHPRSFVSLDNADHFLRNAKDAQYAADVIAAWASRYLAIDAAQPEAVAQSMAQPIMDDGRVHVDELNRQFLRSMRAGRHRLLADEPTSVAGGGDAGPSPYDLLLMALGACTSMTIRQYANRKDYPLDDVKITLGHRRVHGMDCSDCEGREGVLDRIERNIRFEGDLTPSQLDDLLRIANRCPVHRTLENGPVIVGGKGQDTA